MKTRVKNAMQTKVRIPVAPPTQVHSNKVDHNRNQAKQKLRKLLISQKGKGDVGQGDVV